MWSIITSTHGSPCAPQFTDWGAEVMNDVGKRLVLSLLTGPRESERDIMLGPLNEIPFSENRGGINCGQG